MIRRTYGCDECNLEWTVTHDSSDEPYPDCPVCAVKAAWKPQPLRIRSNRSRAMKVTENILEKDFGLKNFNEGTREGDTVARGLAPQTTTEREAMIQQSVEATRQLANSMKGTIRPDMAEALKAFDGKTPAQPQVQQGPIDITPRLAQGRQATAEFKAMHGESPMGLLHKGIKTSKIDPVKSNIIARASY